MFLLYLGRQKRDKKGKPLPTIDLGYVRSCLKIKLIHGNILKLGYFRAQHLDKKYSKSIGVS